MSTPGSVSLRSITDEIDKVIRALMDTGSYPDDDPRNRERAKLVEILEHVSGVVKAAADCKDGSFVPSWSKE